MDYENNVVENESVETKQPTDVIPQNNSQKEMIASFNNEQLSFVCEYCGKVNAIGEMRCGRCGKRRPRSAYLAAIEKAKKKMEQQEPEVLTTEEAAAVEAEQTQKENFNKEIARLVEDRVADEKVSMQQQMDAMRNQDIEDVKRYTARDAVQRIIAVENAADERVRKAQKEAEDLRKQQHREQEATIQSEREKIIYEAAQRMVSERAGIENAADERIANERTQIQHDAIQTIEEAQAEAARKAALKVIASEQANQDKINLERLAMQRAVIDRIEEERKMARKEAEAIFYAEKKAIQEASTQRIEAERKRLCNYGGQFSYQQPVMPQAAQPYMPQGVQPFTIVPYVNPNHPLNQVKTVRKVYRFVPDGVQENNVVENVVAAQPVNETGEILPPPPPLEEPVKQETDNVNSQKKNKKIKKPKKLKERDNPSMILMILSFVFAIGAVLVSVLFMDKLSVISGYKNIEIVSAIFGYVENPIVKLIAAGDIAGTNAILIKVASVGGMAMLVGVGFCALFSVINAFKRRCSIFNLIFACLGLAGGIVFIALSIVVLQNLVYLGTSILIACLLLMFICVVIAFVLRNKKEKILNKMEKAASEKE
ncbi:MAG: hypothetical protein K5765_03140 [Clostridia bacterium]|nr:hypothetical protein [Clostridia bacterium]